MTTAFLFLLVVRPILFGIIGAWMGGVAGGAWYFLRYVPAGLAVTFATILSTIGCAVLSRPYVRTFAYLLRRRM
ncbi:MAG TPA: hypothetical protein VEO20_08760 [Thermoplasmata archaeon]|nr:hypothetical protein [Thermoplasmata archaeon]